MPSDDSDHAHERGREKRRDQSPPAGIRPLRADARRNERLLLDGARAAVAAHGPQVGADRIARYAGVGVATLYRRFPDKDKLVERALLEELDPLLRAARDAAHRVHSGQDPRTALEDLVTRLAEAASQATGLLQIIEHQPATPAVAAARDEILTAVDECLSVSQESGLVRPEVSLEDLGHLLHGVIGSPDGPGGEPARARWKLRLQVVLRGIRSPKR